MEFPPLVSQSRPLLGHALEFKKDRSNLFRRGYAEHGKIFSIKLAGKRGVVLADPELTGFFFKQTDRSLNMAKPYQFLRRALGDVGFVASHQQYLHQRPIMYAPFTREKLNGYLQVMNQVIQGWLDSLPKSGELELTEAVNRLVQEVAGRAILGYQVHEQLGQEFWHHYLRIGQSLDPLLPGNLPLPKFIRRDRSRKALARMLKPILAERRNRPDAYQDVLQDIVSTPLADGSIPDDETVLSMVIALLFAGHETTAGQAAWSIIQILQTPWYQKLLEDEITQQLPHGTMLDSRVLSRLPHVRWAVDETTRLQPSADLLIRVADQELHIAGYRIPKGIPVFLAVEQVQTLGHVFEQPQVYNPLRFAPEMAEQKKTRHCIAGFGGGIHKCAGMSFALGEMGTLIALLFQQFDLDLQTPNPSSVSDFGAKRPAKTFIRFKRKSISASQQIPVSTQHCPYHSH